MWQFKIGDWVYLQFSLVDMRKRKRKRKKLGVFVKLSKLVSSQIQKRKSDLKLELNNQHCGNLFLK